jgi:hypothetical protein
MREAGREQGAEFVERAEEAYSSRHQQLAAPTKARPEAALAESPLALPCERCGNNRGSVESQIASGWNHRSGACGNSRHAARHYCLAQPPATTLASRSRTPAEWRKGASSPRRHYKPELSVRG